MQTLLLHFFQRILEQDSMTLDALSGYGKSIYFDQDNAVLIFTLKGLHQLMTQKDEMTYREFRQCIYGGNLNQELQRLGGKIEMHTSYGKVDKNSYKLSQIKAE